MGFSFENYIHPSAIISRYVKWGEGKNILDGVIIESGVEIEDGNIFLQVY